MTKRILTSMAAVLLVAAGCAGKPSSQQAATGSYRPAPPGAPAGTASSGTPAASGAGATAGLPALDDPGSASVFGTNRAARMQQEMQSRDVTYEVAREEDRNVGLMYYGRPVSEHPSLNLSADQQAQCRTFRAEWVRNYIGRMYNHKFNAPPGGAVNRNAGQVTDIVERMDAAGVSPDACRVPECYSIPYSGWWEPHCGYRIPDSSGKDLYAWVEWRDGLEPPSLASLAKRKDEELRANLRGCPTCTGRHLQVFNDETK